MPAPLSAKMGRSTFGLDLEQQRRQPGVPEQLPQLHRRKRPRTRAGLQQHGARPPARSPRGNAHAVHRGAQPPRPAQRRRHLHQRHANRPWALVAVPLVAVQVGRSPPRKMEGRLRAFAHAAATRAEVRRDRRSAPREHLSRRRARRSDGAGGRVRRVLVDLIEDGSAEVRARTGTGGDLLRHREGPGRDRLRLERLLRPTGRHLAGDHRRHILLEVHHVDRDQLAAVGKQLQRARQLAPLQPHRTIEAGRPAQHLRAPLRLDARGGEAARDLDADLLAARPGAEKQQERSSPHQVKVPEEGPPRKNVSR